MMKAPSRPIMIAILIVLMAVLFPPVQAQDVLIVAPNGTYTTIEAALTAANPGDVIEVHGGTYPAPLVVDKTVSLIGVNQPVIDGQGKGSLVLINAPQVVFSGFIVRGSGQSLAHEDTGIVIQGSQVTVSDNRLEDVMFGIYFADASGGLAQNNIIQGKRLEESMRGDGIRVWYSNDVQLIGNEITHGRDTLIWYADNITIRDNHIHHNRYGLHFMYNENAVVENNIIENNAVGAYMMYSTGLVMTGNRYINNRGASGYGIAFKDMDHAQVADNVFIGNVAAIYLDNSPSLYDEHNIISQNFIAYNDVGLMGLPSVQRNIFQNNTFLENYQQISVQGRGNLLGNIWNQDGIGNYWSNYVGYDRDGDGIGDMPYRAEKLFESLADSEPILRLFAFSPASQAIDFAASAFPSLRPDPKVIDEAPQMHYILPAGIPESSPGVSLPFLVFTLFLLGTGITICVFTLRGSGEHRSSRKSLEAVQTGA
ncbi:MAG: nitrous oxide reductase family maturation protein NosD [Anaerolineae bacterium]|nr:nitrous oxide reductase family maturation protein NosD [Anaerolineae bacterium]